MVFWTFFRAKTCWVVCNTYCFCYVEQIWRKKMSEKPHSIRLLRWFNFSQSRSRKNNRKISEGASVEPTIVDNNSSESLSIGLKLFLWYLRTDEDEEVQSFSWNFIIGNTTRAFFMHSHFSGTFVEILMFEDLKFSFGQIISRNLSWYTLIREKPQIKCINQDGSLMIPAIRGGCPLWNFYHNPLL